ncbi:MAG: hypothetical protein U9N14_04860 [Pseudomonadota bacterium]|nr:hypothetical protein [Pseudomonadota bacterium]
MRQDAIRSKQRGAVLLIFTFVLAVLFGTFLISRMNQNESARDISQITDTKARLARIENSFVDYAARMIRLPCPADGALPDGDIEAGREVRDHTQMTLDNCNAGALARGVVPWLELGLSADDARDGWNRRISYRPFDGFWDGQGGSSWTDGNSLTADRALDAPCLNNQGLFVTGFSNMIPRKKNGAAFVLISHGANGNGAWLVSGAQMPSPSDRNEIDNTTMAGPFRDLAETTTFDDSLQAMTLTDLAEETGLTAPTKVCP